MRKVGTFRLCPMQRILLSTFLASIVAACGSDERGITEPTSPREVFVHNTLNPSGNRSADVSFSWAYEQYTTPFSNLAPWAWDDFTSAEAATIRTVSWQGSYCRRQILAPTGPPPAASISFQVAFSSDVNGRPSYFGPPLHSVSFTPADAHEQFAFNSFWHQYEDVDHDCAYYNYAATLPTPFSVTAGKRYWLLVQPQISNAALFVGGAVSWGWRVGTQDNSISANGSLHNGIFTVPRDLAFSLSTR